MGISHSISISKNAECFPTTTMSRECVCQLQALDRTPLGIKAQPGLCSGAMFPVVAGQYACLFLAGTSLEKGRVAKCGFPGSFSSTPPPNKKHQISSGEIPNSMRCSFQCSHHPSALVEPSWNHLVEPWWNPSGTLPQGRPGPPRSLSGPIDPRAFSWGTKQL